MSDKAKTAAEQHDIIGYAASDGAFERTKNAGARWF